MSARFTVGVSLLFCAAFNPAFAADLVQDSPAIQALGAPGTPPILRGRVSVIGGDTLWFPLLGRSVQLAGIEACPVPQWAFDPKPQAKSTAPVPVPCGSLARAWLKRAVGNKPVICKLTTFYRLGELAAKCSARGRDLGLEMLRVGWARVAGTTAPDPIYLTTENYARSARYGLWGTYVLDMDEWRRKAVDRTMDRQPLADWTLVQEREHEITPPFVDWRNRPPRRDR